MRVAIVTNTSWNIVNFRMNLIQALRKNGHEIHTLAPVDNYTKYLKETGCIHHTIHMDSRGANPLWDMGLLAELWWKYRTIRPDVILHFTIKPNIYGTLAAALLKIPAINNVCGLGTVFLQRGIINRVALWLYKVAFRFPKKVFFQNPDDLKLFLEKNLMKKDLGELVPGSGIDLNRFSPQLFSGQAAGFSRNYPFTFLMISRLIYDKGIAEYMQAIHILKSEGVNVHCQILGAPDPKHKRGISLKIIAEWKRAGLVNYLGATDDVRPFIDQADCIVLPSYREGTPRALLEAAAMQKPIIATDVPGCNQVVQHLHNGFLCELKNPIDLASKMKAMALISDDALLEMGVNGRKKVEVFFDEKIVSTHYLNALNECITTNDLKEPKPIVCFNS